MTAIVAVSATVSVVPITTQGTWIGYVPLPTSCRLAPGQNSCTAPFAAPTGLESTLTPATTTISKIVTVTSIWTIGIHEPSSASPTVKKPEPSAASATSAETNAAAGGSSTGANQTGIALGVTFALLVCMALGWLIFTREMQRARSRQKDQGNEEHGVGMAEVARCRGHEAEESIGPMHRQRSSRSLSGAPSFWAPSSRYSKDIDAEKRLEDGHDSWTNTASSISQRTATVAKDFVSASSEPIDNPRGLPPFRPHSADGFGPVFDPAQSAPPPSQPLPADLEERIEHGRSDVCRTNSPPSPGAVQECGSNYGVPMQNWFGGGHNASNWSLQRLPGSQISQASLQRQPSNGSDVAHSEYNCVTGFEYLMQTGRGDREWETKG